MPVSFDKYPNFKDFKYKFNKTYNWVFSNDPESDYVEKRDGVMSFPEAELLSKLTLLWNKLLIKATRDLRVRLLKDSLSLTKEQIIELIATRRGGTPYYNFFRYSPNEKERMFSYNIHELSKLAIILDVPLPYLLKDEPILYTNSFEEYEHTNQSVISLQDLILEINKIKKNRTTKSPRVINGYIIKNEILYENNRTELISTRISHNICVRVDITKDKITTIDFYFNSDLELFPNTLEKLMKTFNASKVYAMPATLRPHRKICFVNGKDQAITDFTERMKFCTNCTEIKVFGPLEDRKIKFE
jgi:hypothetical protein